MFKIGTVGVTKSRSITVSAFLKPGAVDAVEAAALATGKSMSAMIRGIIDEWVAAHPAAPKQGEY